MDGVKLLRGERLPEGFELRPLRRIPDERGTILHMLRATDPHFRQFGEIYFSTAYPGVIKGWHRHREMTLNYACIHGRIKLVVYDDRDGSATRGALAECYLGPDAYYLAIIPPELWNGFKSLSAPYAIVANCSTHSHDPRRSTRLDPFSPTIPYDWSLRNE